MELAGLSSKEATTMEWKTVRQCHYKGYTITDTGAGFWIHRPNGGKHGRDVEY